MTFHSLAIQAADSEESPPALPEQIRDFKTCALLSLKRIPQLQRSKMEIDIRHLDEDDSSWSYVPELKLTSFYYVSEDDTTVSFSATNYRPWEPYYDLQARQLITQIVMLKHVQATALVLHKLADTFLQLVAFSQIDKHYQNISDLYEKRFRYAEKRQQSNTTAPVEWEIEKQTLAYLTAEHKANAVQRETLINGLCITMDLPEPEIFNLDNLMVLEQILGPSELKKDIDPPAQSIEQQIMAKKLLLQDNKIILAYSRYMPDFSLGVRSPDVLNVSTNEDSDLFFYVGMSLTLWDGQKRARDITRQKMMMQQMRIEKKEIENNERLAWLEATQKYSLAKSEQNLALSIEKMKSLEAKKNEFDYNKGTIKLPEFIDHQIAIQRASIDTIRKELTLNRALLQLRYLSGQLLKDTVNISLAEIPYE